MLARQQNNIPLSEAITYTNLDVGSVLRYRMYLITFPQKYLKKFQTILAKTVKTLAKLASSTPTDLLISQGLLNVINLQRTVRTEFLLSLFDSIDEPTRISTTIAYSHIRYSNPFSGVCPFSSRGLQIPCKDSRLALLFRAIRPA